MKIMHSPLIMAFAAVFALVVSACISVPPADKLIGTTEEGERLSQVAGVTVVDFQACVPTGIGPLEGRGGDEAAPILEAGVIPENPITFPENFPAAMRKTLAASCTPISLSWTDGRAKGHVSLKIYNPVSGYLLAHYEADDVSLPEALLMKLAQVKETIAGGQQNLTAEVVEDITDTITDVLRILKMGATPIPLPLE